MRIKILPVLLVVLVLLFAANVNASVYRLYELGAKAATLAGAYAGRADNTSAIYYNPAGLAIQNGLGFRVNVVYFNLKHSAYVPDEDATYTSANGQLRGSLFVAYTFIDRISIGIGYFQPYTMETDWFTNWPGVTLSLNSRLEISYFRSVLAFKFNDMLFHMCRLRYRSRYDLLVLQPHILFSTLHV